MHAATRRRARSVPGERMLVRLVVLACALVATGCGGGDDEQSVPVIGYMNFRDATGFNDDVVARCEQRAKGAYRVEQISMGPTVDAAREQLTRRLAARDTSMDVLTLDTVWTAEFSEAGWLRDVTDEVRAIEPKLVPAAVDSVRAGGRYWAMPVGTNVPLLYYRTDLVPRAPRTWEELAAESLRVIEQHPDMTGFVFQAGQYEGGTVNAIEFISGAGGSVLSDDGTRAELDDGDAAQHALEWVGTLTSRGISPRAISTFMEEDGRQLFQQGGAVFMRNWPYAYALMGSDDSSKVRGRFGIAPLPGFEGRSSAAVLGGQNFAVSAHSKHPDLAWKLISCLAERDVQADRLVAKGELPTREDVYRDGAIVQQVPYLPIARAALDSGVNRPVTSYYNDVTVAISRGWNDTVAGRTEPADAVGAIDSAVQRAIDGQGDI